MTEETNQQTEQQTQETTQTSEATKAYSELHNKHKATTEANEALTAEVAELRKAAQTKQDGSKDSETLMIELNEMRTKNEGLTAKVSGYESEIEKQIASRSEGLTDNQKKLVEYSDQDPFKKLNFINELKGQPAVVKSSQGNPVVDTGEITLDIQFIANQADKGNVEPLHEAYKKYGKQKVQDWIAAKSTIQPNNFDMSPRA